MGNNWKLPTKVVEPIKERKTGITDIHGKEVLYGSIINADGYKSQIERVGDEPPYLHCVEYYNGVYGSDIYSDFEPLSSYKEIEIVGHVNDFIETYKNGEWAGNLGAVLRYKPEKHLYSDYLTSALDLLYKVDGYLHGTPTIEKEVQTFLKPFKP